MARHKRIAPFSELEYEVDYTADMCYTDEPINEFHTIELFLMPHVHNMNDSVCLRNMTSRRCSTFKKLRRDVLSDWMKK